MTLFEFSIVGILLACLVIICIGFWLVIQRLGYKREKDSTFQADLRSTVEQIQQETKDLATNLRAEQQVLHTSVTEIKTLQSQSQRDVREWRDDTYKLSRALRTTHQQGSWGELELKRIIEFAGMQQYYDFNVQVKSKDGTRPDVVVYLHDNRSIVIDAHAPSQAYIDAMEIEDEKERKARLKAYASNVKDKMRTLANKVYWQDFQPNPELVVLFLSNEAMFRAALEYDSKLLEDAMQKGVLLASPITLIAVLKGIAYGWTQHNLTLNTQKIIDKSKEISTDLKRLLEQWQQIRGHMYKTHTQFDQMLALYHQTLLPHLTELGALESALTLPEKTMDLESLPLETATAQSTQMDAFSLPSFVLTKIEEFRDRFQAVGPFPGAKGREKDQNP